MRAISLSRALAVFGALMFAAACTDSTGPNVQPPDPTVSAQPAQPDRPTGEPEAKGGKQVKPEL
jgi:hypothetical protein